MVSRRSHFSRSGLAADQSLTAMADRSFIGGLAHESPVNRDTKSLIALLSEESADRDSQDKNLVGSLNRFAKTAVSRNWVDSIFTHVYPICMS